MCNSSKLFDNKEETWYAFEKLTLSTERIQIEGLEGLIIYKGMKFAKAMEVIRKSKAKNIKAQDNSIKYTSSGGKVEVIADYLHRKVLLEIKYTGIGIPEEDIHKVFEEFYRAENARKIEKEGTGLGLAISKNIIETYGGNIQIESKVNEGTKFIIILPI